MDVEVGSNLYRNTDGTIEIEGVPQIQVTLKEPANGLLVNFALFDGNGKMIAKLVESTLMFNERRAYEVMRTPTRVTLSHVESKQVVLEMDVKAPGHVVFTRGGFHSVKGHLVEVSPKEWKVGKQQASGTTQDAKGGAIKIG
jgi:hypothetical protein